MIGILTATVSVAVIGLVIGVVLVYAGNRFKVETNEKEIAVRECLPGNNCGACGFAGCDAMAAAIAKGEAPANGCPVGGEPAAKKIGRILGVEVKAAEKTAAFVKCSGSCEYAARAANYIGIPDCAAAAGSGLSPWSCSYGCLGFGTCARVCPFGAITVKNGVARVDRDKCKACGKCVAVCPKHLIEMVPEFAKYAVRCASPDRGPAVKKACTAGCIGCRICEKQCGAGAVTVTDNLAHIDCGKCTGCGKCAEKCPQKVICNPNAI